MTRVRKAAAVSLMTSMALAAIGIGLSEPADADLCPPLASASIQAPTGTVTAGSSVHVSAQINGLMLMEGHLQISGPGLDQQVGPSVVSGPIQGDVTVSKAGYFTLAVVGNGTKCTYKTAGFSVEERPSASPPTRHSTPGKTPSAGRRAGSPRGGRPLSTGIPGSGSAGGNNYPSVPLNGTSPFSLPSVVPDGAGQGFVYPSPDPQIASPPSRPLARNASQTMPIKWGQSLALALVLLIISAHLGMWSRRQRLAAEGRRTARDNKRSDRKKEREAATLAAKMSASAAAEVAEAGMPAHPDVSGGAEALDGADARGSAGTAGTAGPDGPDGAGVRGAAGTHSSGRGYRGRRRRR